MDLSYISLESKKYDILFVDSPGHKDLINYMIYGANICDKSIIVISVLPNEFESGMDCFYTGISENGQTKEDLYLLKNYGISDVIIILNKMDFVIA